MESMRQALHFVASRFRAWIANLGGKPAVRLLLLLWTRLQFFVRLKRRQNADISRTKYADGGCFSETIYPSRPPPAPIRSVSWTAIRRADSPALMSRSPSVFDRSRTPSPLALRTMQLPTSSMPELRSAPSLPVRQDVFAPFPGPAQDTLLSPAHQEAFVPLSAHGPDMLHTLGHSPSNPASEVGSVNGTTHGEDALHPSLPHSRDQLQPASTQSRPSLSQSMQSNNGVRQSVITGSIHEPDYRSGAASLVNANPAPPDYLRENKIYPIDVTDIMRYDRPITKKPLDVELIDPLMLTFSRGNVPSDVNWVPYTHPEGALYFYDTQLKYFTDANLYDPVVCKRVELCRAHIEYAKHLLEAEFPADAEIVIEIPPPEDEEYAQGYYYCVAPARRVVFWLNLKLAGPTLGDTKLFSTYQIKHELEFQFWKHWELFPMEREISEHLLQEAIGKLVHAGLDLSTSKTSAAPYNGDLYVKSIHGYSVVAVARVMSDFAQGKYVHFHGLPEARLNRTQARTADGQRPPTMLITAISPICIFAPNRYFHRIKETWVDNLVHQHAWKKHVAMIQEDWAKYILPATVLLSANVTLLFNANFTRSHRGLSVRIAGDTKRGAVWP